MNDDLFPKKHRREPLNLQLTAMIDIFSLIVIFLIMGTVMGGVEMDLPAGLKLPRSLSKESVESAPRLVLQNDQVSFELLHLHLPVSAFSPDPALAATAGTELAEFKSRLQEYVAQLPASARSAGTLLNVIADEKTPYRKVFDVIHVFREAGFETLLFVTAGQEVSGNK